MFLISAQMMMSVNRRKTNAKKTTNASTLWGLMFVNVAKDLLKKMPTALVRSLKVYQNKTAIWFLTIANISKFTFKW